MTTFRTNVTRTGQAQQKGRHKVPHAGVYNPPGMPKPDAEEPAGLADTEEQEVVSRGAETKPEIPDPPSETYDAVPEVEAVSTEEPAESSTEEEPIITDSFPPSNDEPEPEPEPATESPTVTTGSRRSSKPPAPARKASSFKKGGKR